MSSNWDGPYLQSYAPDDLITRKEVTDNGRTVNVIYALNATGDYSASQFGGGQATVPIEQRDNYPLIEEGDIVSAYTYSPYARHPITHFIVTDVAINEESDGSGSITYSGPGLPKELIRKIVKRPYIAVRYIGSSSWYNKDNIYLQAGHQQADDFYNGGVYEMLGYFADITDYDSAANLLTVDNWTKDVPPAGTDPQTYTIYAGKTAENLKQATDWDNTGWLNHINGLQVEGTPGGSYHFVEGKTCLEMLDVISKETGWRYRRKIEDLPRRVLEWFDSTGSPVDSGIKLYKSSEHTAAEWQVNPLWGVIISCTRSSSRREHWTRIIGSTEDSITLAGLTLADITLPAGFAVDFNASMVINTATEFDYHQSEIFEKSRSYKDIKAQSDTPEAIKAAQISLFYQMIDTLRFKDKENYTYNVTTSIREDVQVGEQLYLKYARYVTGELQWDVADNLWIRSITLSANSEDGIRYVNVEIGTNLDTDVKDGDQAAASAIKDASSGGGSSIVFNQSSSPPAALYRHGNLLGLGVVSDHPAYLLRDGSRSLQGNLTVESGIKLDTVDLSDFKALYDAHINTTDDHHDPVTAGDHITLSNQQVAVLVTSNADTFPEVVLASDVNGRLQLDGLGINTAPTGSGLTITGFIDLTGDIDIAGDINFGGARYITSDAGSNLYIQPGSNLVLRPANKRIYLDDSIYFDAAGNIITDSGNLLLNPFGDLDIDADIIFQGAQSIKTSTGILTIAPADDLALSPVGGNVSIAANLDFQGAHEITTTTGLLTIKPTGDLFLDPVSENIQVDADIDFQSARSIKTVSGNLTLAPWVGTVISGNLAVGSSTDVGGAAVNAIAVSDTDHALFLKQRVSQEASIFRIEDSDGVALILLSKDGNLESGNPGFSSGETGWQINHLGDAEFNDLWARGEFHASIFVVDEMHAANGTVVFLNSGSVAPAINENDNKLPALLGNTFVINLKASIGSSLSLFTVNDIIRLKFIAHNGTAMDVWDVALEVESIALIAGRDLTTNDPGYFATTCTWRYGGEASLVIPSSTVGAKWGRVNDTGYVGGMMITSDQDYSPFLSVFTLPADHTWGVMPEETSRVRLGNLGGVLGIGEDEWGLALGTDLADTNDNASNIIISDKQFRIQNVDHKVINVAGDPTVLIASDGNVKFGTDIDVASGTLFHFDPAAGSLLLRDTEIQMWAASVKKGSITPGGSLYFGSSTASHTTISFAHYGSETSTPGDVRIGRSSSSRIEFDDSAGTVSLIDADLQMFNGALQTVEITQSGEMSLGTNVASSDTTTFHVWPSGSVTMGDYSSGAHLYWDNNNGVLNIKNSLIQIYGADGLRHAYIGSDGYFFLGENTTTHASISFAHYGESAGALSGDIRMGTLAAGKSNVFWDQDAGTLSIRNYLTPVIVFDGPDSYFAGTMSIGENGEIVAGGTILDDDGLTFDVSNSGYFTNEYIKFKSGATDIGRIRAYYSPGIPSIEKIELGIASGGYRTFISLGEGSLSSMSGIRLETYYNITAKSIGGAIYLENNTTVTGDLKISSGVYVGDQTGSADTGQLILDQGIGDGTILQFRSDDFNESTHGQAHANTYLQFSKSAANTGGGLIRGASTDYHGLYLTGSSGAAPTGLSQAPIILSARRDNSTVPTGHNLLSLLNYTTVKLAVKEDGDLYIAGTYEIFDHLENDAEMTRALSLLSPNAIPTQFDKFVRYNREDLIHHKLIEEVPGSYMVNTTGMMRLHNGAIWQLYVEMKQIKDGDSLAMELFGQRLAIIETQIASLL